MRGVQRETGRVALFLKRRLVTISGGIVFSPTSTVTNERDVASSGQGAVPEESNEQTSRTYCTNSLNFVLGQVSFLFYFNC